MEWHEMRMHTDCIKANTIIMNCHWFNDFQRQLEWKQNPVRFYNSLGTICGNQLDWNRSACNTNSKIRVYCTISPKKKHCIFSHLFIFIVSWHSALDICWFYALVCCKSSGFIVSVAFQRHGDSTDNRWVCKQLERMKRKRAFFC